MVSLDAARVTVDALLGIRAGTLVTGTVAWSGVVVGSTVFASEELVTLALTLVVEVSVVHAHITFSRVATSAALTDWVAWSLVGIVSVVDVDITLVAFVVLVTDAFSVLILVLVRST